MPGNESHIADVRLVRVLLPASLLREVDQLVLSGRGGYESRHEFFAEAIQNQVLEVKHGATDDGQLLLARDLGQKPAPPAAVRATRSDGNGPAPRPEQREEAPALPAALADGEPIAQLTDLSETALPAVERGAALDSGVAVFKQEPLFGLHNRDYPSLWALSVAARMTASGPLPASQVYAQVTRQAWRYARSLTSLEKQVPGKPTALFPTNIAKPQSAEEGFRGFALGAVNRKLNAQGNFETAGPLFSWQAVQLIKVDNGTPNLGLTAAGWDPGRDGGSDARVAARARVLRAVLRAPTRARAVGLGRLRAAARLRRGASEPD